MQLILKNAPCANPNSSLNRGKKMSLSDGKIKRDNFTSRWGFVLASIGSAVGMGNIWRFPVMISTYGGLTFLIPYVIFVIIIASTGVIEEFSLGRLFSSGPIGAFKGAMASYAEDNNKSVKKAGNVGKSLGFIPVLGSLAMAIGYTVVMSWILKYAFMSVFGSLYAMGQNMDVIGATFGETASAWGANIWIVLTICVSFIIMFFGVSGGIERANKVMMPILFFLFVALGIYISTLNGASEGYKYIFSINLPEFASVQDAFKFWAKILVFAFGQAFFSLSVAGNGSVIYGSYLKKDADLPLSSRNVAVFDTLAALLAALVIIPAIATTGGVVSTGGPGLMFIYLVNVINGMAGGRIIGASFFIIVTFAGLSSIINLYETPIAFLQDEFKIKRSIATVIIHVLGGGIAICIQAITAQWMDVVSIYVCPLGALLAGIMFFYFLNKDKALSEVNRGSKKPIGKWFYPAGKYVYCSLALIALVCGAFFGGIG